MRARLVPFSLTLLIAAAPLATSYAAPCDIDPTPRLGSFGTVHDADLIGQYSLWDEAERRKLQWALVWAGGYASEVDGIIGPATIQAIRAYQAANGLLSDGVLQPRQLQALYRRGNILERAAGFQRVSDESAGFDIGIPTRDLTFDRKTKYGSAYKSTDGGLEIQTLRIQDDRTLCGFYWQIIGLPGRQLVQKISRDRSFILRQIEGGQALFLTAYEIKGQDGSAPEIRALSVSYPLNRAAEYQRTHVAVWTAFKRFSGEPEPDLTGTPHPDPKPRERDARPLDRDLSPPEVFRRVSPSVYLIVAASSADGDNASLGSAVAISDRLALTNCHVVEDRPLVIMKDGDTLLRAEVTTLDKATDRCTLEVAGRLRPIAGVRPFEDLAVGEPVFTIGNPSGLERTLGQGLVSGLRRTERGRLVQTSAPFSRGSSGGALVDGRGNLIGITTFYLKDAQGLNFAIAADEYCTLLSGRCRYARVTAR